MSSAVTQSQATEDAEDAADVGHTTSANAASENLQDAPPDVMAPGGHKRSLSGSLLSKLTFLRSNADKGGTGTAKLHTDGINEDEDSPRSPSDAAVSPVEEKKTRKRKGSLRKTAILGTGRLRLEGREKNPSPLDTTTLNTTTLRSPSPFSPISPDSPSDHSTPRPSYETVPSKTPLTTQKLVRTQTNASDDSISLTSLSRKSTLGDMSTTSDDDALTFSRTPLSSTTAPILKKPSADTTSYFPPAPPLLRRRSSNKPKSPLASLPLEPITPPEVWDYTETEWWGWVILIMTWLVFVIGMGSCFGVWSWAWDVGETPYAPPELEDDPTLPITGYYPALIVLTGVVAWVWVTIAWVGMKYFKHAKISGED
jgi:hypothetical protein